MTDSLTMSTWAYVVAALVVWGVGYVTGRRYVDRDLRAAQRLAHEYQCRLVDLAAQPVGVPLGPDAEALIRRLAEQPGGRDG